jgi:hypothetical protein
LPPRGGRSHTNKEGQGKVQRREAGVDHGRGEVGWGYRRRIVSRIRSVA